MKKYRKPSILHFQTYKASSGSHGKFRRSIFSEFSDKNRHKGFQMYIRSPYSFSPFQAWKHALTLRRKKYGR